MRRVRFCQKILTIWIRPKRHQSVSGHESDLLVSKSSRIPASVSFDNDIICIGLDSVRRSNCVDTQLAARPCLAPTSAYAGPAPPRVLSFSKRITSKKIGSLRLSNPNAECSTLRSRRTDKNGLAIARLIFDTVRRVGFEPTEANGQQIYSLPSLTT